MLIFVPIGAVGPHNRLWALRHVIYTGTTSLKRSPKIYFLDFGPAEKVVVLTTRVLKIFVAIFEIPNDLNSCWLQKTSRTFQAIQLGRSAPLRSEAKAIMIARQRWTNFISAFCHDNIGI